MKTVRVFSAVAMLALYASLGMAQDAPPAGGGAGGPGGGRGRGGMTFNPVDMLKNRIKSLNLSSDDQAKVDAIFKEYEPKVAEAQKTLTTMTTEMRDKVMEQLTPEQKTKLESMRGQRGGGRGQRGGGGGAYASGSQARSLIRLHFRLAKNSSSRIGAAEVSVAPIFLGLRSTPLFFDTKNFNTSSILDC